MKKTSLFLILSVLVIFSSGEIFCKVKSEKYSDYSINLSIDPESRDIIVDGILIYRSKNALSSDLSIYIDSNMVFDKLLVNGIDFRSIITEKSDNRFLPIARKIIIKNRFLKRNDNLIEFSYKGKLMPMEAMSANIVSKEWTEIGLYYPWFLFSPDFIKLFTYNISVKNLSGYSIFGLGNVTVNKWTTNISSFTPTNDMPICMSEKSKLTIFNRDNVYINFYHNPINYELLPKFSSDILQMAHNLQNVLSRRKNFEITIIESLRENGGGYARVGGVVLGELKPNEYDDNRVAMKKYIAHELAHLWWYRANTSEWEDWLNESFAEMSSLMAIRQTEGEEVFASILEKKRNNSLKTPPLWGFDRNGCDYETAHKILYSKGVCFLIDLEEKLGRESFAKLFSSLSDTKLTSTGQLLDYLSRTCGEDIANWFEHKLKFQ